MVPKVRLLCGVVEARWRPFFFFFYLLHTRGSEQGGASAAASLIRKGRTRRRQRRAARGECLNLSKLRKRRIKCCEKRNYCTLAAVLSKYNRFLAYVVACVGQSNFVLGVSSSSAKGEQQRGASLRFRASKRMLTCFSGSLAFCRRVPRLWSPRHMTTNGFGTDALSR